MQTQAYFFVNIMDVIKLWLTLAKIATLKVYGFPIHFTTPEIIHKVAAEFDLGFLILYFRKCYDNLVVVVVDVAKGYVVMMGGLVKCVE